MTSTNGSDHVRIAIVGTGFSGLGMAIKLKEAGVEDFTILERADDVGGTWRDNTYPGCQCDVPSHLYSFSFAPNPDWSRTYSKQAEIWDYLREVTDRYGMRPHIRFEHDVTDAAWDDDERVWRLETSQGELTCEILIAGSGALVEPQIPDIPGLDSFEGAVFHSARWDHDYDLEGKRVASIGTGASAIQYVPEIQPKVEQLHVFQRTPPWIMRHTDRPITGLERRLYRRFPRLQRLTRAGVYLGREWLVLGFVKRQRLMKRIQKLAEAQLRRQVKDPELREKLRPSYTFGCKRILPTNRWYPALQQPNVEVVTEGIVEVKPNAVVSADGREREVDAIILGTGFHVTDMPMTQHIRGRDGRLMSEQFEGEGTEGYLGTVVKNFPNFFFLTGPNTGLGHTSMVYMIESQIRYIVDAVRTMEREGIATLEVRPEAQAEFNQEIQSRMTHTVWMRGGCASWYIDDKGRNSTLWPDWTFRFRQRTSRFDLPSYVTTPAREREPVAA
jgi:cation diffusion facilitator CzcD-associated flavoprotein CzcO